MSINRFRHRFMKIFILFTILCYFPTIKGDGHYVAVEDSQLCFAREVAISSVDRKQLDKIFVGFFYPALYILLSSSGGCNNAVEVQEGFDVLNFMTTICQLCLYLRLIRISFVLANFAPAPLPPPKFSVVLRRARP